MAGIAQRLPAGFDSEEGEAGVALFEGLTDEIERGCVVAEAKMGKGEMNRRGEGRGSPLFQCREVCKGGFAATGDCECMRAKGEGFGVAGGKGKRLRESLDGSFRLAE